jgi:hypothetical protein
LYSFIALLEKAIKEFLNKAVLFNDFFDDEDAHLEVDFDGEKVKYCYLAEDGLTFSSLYNKYKSLKEAFEAQIPVCIVSMKQKTKL